MNTKKTKGRQLLLSALAVVLVFCCSIGGTLAWLTAKTDPVVNTFTIGNIEIELWESKYDLETDTMDYDTLVKENTYKIVPGMRQTKDPLITIKAGSEPCWLFLKVDEKNFISGIKYTIWERNGPKWKKLDSEENIYYVEYTPNTYPNYFEDGVLSAEHYVSILYLNQFTVSGEVTKEQLDSIRDKEVSLSFTAYAIQYEGFPTVEKAWEQVNATYHITTPAASGE